MKISLKCQTWVKVILFVMKYNQLFVVVDCATRLWRLLFYGEYQQVLPHFLSHAHTCARVKIEFPSLIKQQ